MNHMDHNVQRGDNHWIVERFKSTQQQKNKWVQFVSQLLLDINDDLRSLLVLIATQNETSLFKGLSQTLQTEVCQDSSANFHSLFR